MIDFETKKTKNTDLITIFLAGDVMTGRAIDQIQRHPGDPALYEAYLKDARAYIELAVRASGPVPNPVEPAYVWGDALQVLEKALPDVRIINLETAITRSNDFWQWKEVHYRMNPENIECLSAAKFNACSLANNHILDWGYEGLVETLEMLKKGGIKSAGAGMNLTEAEGPAIIEVKGKGRVVLFACGSPTSGIPVSWAAEKDKPGVCLLSDFSEGTIGRVREKIQGIKREKDIVVFSLHWGGNWGYEISEEERRFAHRLIESGVDIVHGHSSHHVKGIEVYRDRPVFYGCGDFLNDYEGIPGYEDYRPDLGLMYFPALDPATGRLAELRMAPTRIRGLRVNQATADEARILAAVLNREGKRLGTAVESGKALSGTLVLRMLSLLLTWATL